MKYCPSLDEPPQLDVGAVTSPSRADVLALGYSYRSHDFGEYVNREASPGVQSYSWAYLTHDFICNVTDIPQDAAAEVPLCTEVLECVPDPVVDDARKLDSFDAEK